MKQSFVLLIVICTGLSGCTSTPSQTAQALSIEHEAGSPVEDIYVVRSVRQSRMAPTTFCDATHTRFAGATYEDQYIFRSVSTRTSDGLIVDASVQTVGTIHACFGPTSDRDVLNFYGEGELGATAFRGLGECRSNLNFPEVISSGADAFLI